MIRTAFLLCGTLFHTVMIACAIYVYLEAVHPYLERRIGPVPFASTPLFRAAGEYRDDALAALGAPG